MLVDCTIRALYNAPVAGESYVVPAVLIDFAKLLDLEFMSEFKTASDALAPTGETAAQAAERRFGHTLRIMMLFAGCYMLTQGIRRADIQSKAAHEGMRQLSTGASTSKYYGAAGTASLIAGQSTKAMSGGTATFAASIACCTYFWASYLFSRQGYLGSLIGSQFLNSYLSCTCKKGIIQHLMVILAI